MLLHVKQPYIFKSVDTIAFFLQATIREDIPIGHNILQVTATDPDSGQNGQIQYGLADSTPQEFRDLFAINDKGVLYNKQPVDYERAQNYHLSITARDRGENSRPIYSKVVIHVEDINDHPPEINVNALTQSGHAGNGVNIFVDQNNADHFQGKKAN